ncbi:MAG: ATP-binding protein [Gemmatirosa sp.]
MRLADFIRANQEPILAEWEAFARTCTPAGRPMNITALRDHAGQMLTVIAADLAEPQSGAAQSEKSKGRAPDEGAGASTAAEEHGAGRAESGFAIEQMVAEFRALRASVLRLWTKSERALETADIEDLTRFNEAIDQALAESVARFNREVEHAKETFLAILGHDLRTPLGAIQTSATFLLEIGEREEVERTLLTRIAASSSSAVTMVGDLLDFTRSHLGGGIPVVRADADVSRIVREVVAEHSAAHPGLPIRVDAPAEERGQWDAARLSQSLGNLIGNAVQHGAEGTTVTVCVHGTAEEVSVAVHNRGVVLPFERLDGIFNPMRTRGPGRTAAARGPTGSLGLGLYIAERIVHAHDGCIEVKSSEEEGTTFTVRLPRREASTTGPEVQVPPKVPETRRSPQ